ncbi:MAG: 50S ribosomal protein L24 [Dehalococcoidales bacterium]|nr:50S ribosomal protein L24 [Dehalococcoidales bacterium]
MKIRKGDSVLVITGKDRGKKGKVRTANYKDNRVVVEGANIIKKHAKAIAGAQQGGIVEREASLHVSDVMLMCNKCNHPARIGVRVLEGGKKVRFCRVCQEVID